MQNVLLDYGLEGYGLYWYCIELIAGKVDKENITFELEHDARIIARNTGCTPQKVEEMMRYFVDIGLFENSQGVITCLKIARRLDKSMTSNPEMRTIIEKLKNHDEVMTPSEKPMQDKIRLEENKDICTDKPVNEPSKRTVCPYEDIKIIYCEELPMLTGCRKMDAKTKKQILAIWKSEEQHQSLDFWRMYFQSIKRLTNRMPNWAGEVDGTKHGTLELLTRDKIFARSVNELIDQGVWK